MQALTCDVAIIGAGTAGLSARTAAARAGASVLLIESGPGGTTCASTGCMPSKLLIAAAGAAHGVSLLGEFGLSAGPLQVDGPAVMRRVRRLRDEFVGGVLESMEAIPADGRLHGRARFAGPTTLLVDERRVDAKAIVIATGSRPSVPAAFRALGDLVLTNETVFELPDLPASLAVIGAGPVGIELAQAFGRLGVRVTVFDSGGSVGGLSDPRVAAAARDSIGRELDLVLGADVSAERAGSAARLAWTTRDDGAGEAEFARVLVAAGRPPALDGLDLDRAELALGPKGVPVFDAGTLRCGDGAVYIAGDAAADRPVLHEAAFEGTVAGRNAARHPHPRPSERMARLAVTYTEPEIAVVGGGWRALEARDPAVSEVDLSRSGRARVMARNAGLLRLYADRQDGRLLGAEMAGPEAEHIGHLLAWAVQAGMTVDAMLDLPFYHPTVEESVRTALRRLCGDLNRRPKTRAGDLEYGPAS